MTRVELRSPDISWSEIDGDVVVLDQSRAIYFRVRGAGIVLWPLIVRGVDDSALADELVDVFGIEVAAAAVDAQEFVAQLWQLELVSWEPPG